jgi:hypothetical protein
MKRAPRLHSSNVKAKFEVAKEMKSLKTAMVLLCFAVLAMPFGPRTKADEMDKKTTFTFSTKAPN